MRILTFIAALLLFSTSFSWAQSQEEVLTKIKKETEKESQVMKSISYLSDVFGPRLMGTPNYYNAVVWAEKQLRSWGITHTQLQSFDKGHQGWELESFTVEMLEPSYSHINAYPLAYTASTEGTQTGEVILVTSFKEIFALKEKLAGKILLLKGYYSPVGNVAEPLSQRLTEETLKRAEANPDPNDVIIGYHGRRSTADIFRNAETRRKEQKELLRFCKDQGVIALVEPSDFPYGILHADGNRAIPSFFKKDDDFAPIASFVIANEHFGRLVRLVESGYKPKLKVDLKAKFYKEPKYNVNLIAEIPGSDPKLKEELVLIGGHLDSWHAGTGAVDNASNCAVLMEALRLLHQAHLKPKRTIRLVLWGGEEQVFAGSAAYIEQRVGNLYSAEPKAEKSKISAYLNLDNGAGMIRGLYLMGNKSVEPLLAEYLEPFPLSKTLTLQNANQTVHELFDYQNIPAFQFIQDPLDYITAVHHTNMDVYEYVPEKDQKYNAGLIAYLAFRIAESDQLLPRKKYNSPVPSRRGNVTFKLPGFKEAKQAFLVGDFNNWSMFGTPLYQTKNGWECKIDLTKNRYYYKFIVDGHWTADPKTPSSQLVKDGKGHGGLTILQVK